MRLTNKAIKSFRYRGGWDVRWDEAIPGFGVRLYASGKRSFVLSYRSDGRKRLMVLGRFGADLTIEQARDRARKLRVEVREGADPVEERRRAGQGNTLGDLIDAYLERHASQKRTGHEDERKLKLHIPASWRSRRASAIRRAEIAELHHKLGLRAPYESNRLLEVLRKMFRLGQVWGYVDESHSNPAEGIDKFKEKKRKRWVTPEEVRRLAQAIDGEPNVYVRAAFWLLLLTGLRRSELLQAKWSDVDFDRDVLNLPETKSGEEQSVPLSGAALAILQSVPRQEGNPFILAGSKQGQHMVNIGRPWNRIRHAAGVDDVRLHDLRRTVGSWFTQAGVDLNVVREGLRHANIATTLIYARLGQDAARDAFEEHGRQIMEAAGKQRPVEVVSGGNAK